METPNLTLENVEKIEKLFPNCIVEAEDEEGNKIKKVDFDLLRAELWDKASVEWLDERYRLDWPGKKRSILKANTPITKTLRPVKEDSVDRDNTWNLYIEWDNFEVLKILQESYLWKIKMIYIDPPYNTWNDFIYDDNYIEDTDEYKEKTEQNDEWYKMIRNMESNWRFHSDWLSMMYERIKIARDLLRDDWVFFISIWAQEVENLNWVLNEIFWEKNKLTLITRIQKKWGNKWAFFNPTSDFIYVYAKNIDALDNFVELEIDEKIYNKIETEGERKWEKYAEVILYMPNLEYRPNQRFYVDCPDWSRIIPPEWKSFRRSEERFKDEFNKWNVLIKPSKNSQLIKEDWSKADYIVYQKRFLKDTLEKGTARPNNLIENFPNTMSSKELAELDIPFDYAKPVWLIKYLFKIAKTWKDDIVLDFFSWSSSTAHSIIDLNAEDWWNRKFIMVQLPELTEEESEAYKKWYKNICEIWKERIRRAWKKIKEETWADIDYGFRVYRVDESCMKDVYYHPSEAKQENLALFTSNIKEDRTPEDLLTQVILNFWLTLDLPIEEKTIWKNKVFYVAWNSLIACFDENIDDNVIDEIAKDEPIKLVFRDACFKNDAQRINVENKVKRVSPETIIKVI